MKGGVIFSKTVCEFKTTMMISLNIPRSNGYRCRNAQTIRSGLTDNINSYDFPPKRTGSCSPLYPRPILQTKQNVMSVF